MHISYTPWGLQRRRDGTTDLVHCTTLPRWGSRSNWHTCPVQRRYYHGLKPLLDRWYGSNPIRKFATRAKVIGSVNQHADFNMLTEGGLDFAYAYPIAAIGLVAGKPSARDP